MQTLQENERFQFASQVGWILSENLVTCRDGTQSNSILPPTCGVGFQVVGDFSQLRKKL